MSGHECFRCPGCGSCPACAADALDRVIEEAERYRERLDQFDAHGFPNVASALDRVNAAEARAARYEAALRPFVDPASYSTTEEECRLNPAMDWCAVHSFHWPCPVDAARADLAKGDDRE